MRLPFLELFSEPGSPPALVQVFQLVVKTERDYIIAHLEFMSRL